MLKNIHHKDFDCEDEESIADLERQIEVKDRKRIRNFKADAVAFDDYERGESDGN